MTEAQLGNPFEQSKASTPPVNLDKILKGNWPERLNTDNFEDAQSSLSELRALRQWRSDSQKHALTPFYRLLETATSVKGMPVSDSDRSVLISDLVDRLMPASQTLSPRLRDIYLSLISELDGSPYTPQFEMTTEQLSKLKESGDLATLLDPSIPWVIKQNRMETRVLGDLRGRRALDKRDSQQSPQKADQEKENGDQPTSPPPANDEAKPGMDEMQKGKEGEIPPAIWTISPAYGGYYKEQVFNRWDTTTNSWKADYNLQPVVFPSQPSEVSSDMGSSQSKPQSLTISCSPSSNGQIRIPMPYGYDIDPTSYKSFEFLNIDQNGDYILKPLHGGGTEEIYLTRTSQSRIRNSGLALVTIPSNLTDETSKKLAEVNGSKKGNLQKARALSSYTMRRLTYSNDSSYNSRYDSDSKGYIGAIDELKQADCDVANTYFASLCGKLNIPVRFVVGHMVKGKDKQGNARVTSGTGHAWCEVWDEVESKWVRVDATPPGDPNMEEKQEKGESVPGDYGEQEALGPTDEELAKLESQLSELTERLSYTPAERELAEAAGVDLKEARSIVKEIHTAEGTRLKNGELVTDVLSQLFSRIVETRKTSTPDYTGPLRKREGGEEIEDIVAHVVGVKSGEQDPISRQIPSERIHQAASFGGFDVYFVGDKSGSMSQTVDGETKWKMQRQAQYLILSSLNRFSENLRRAETIMTDPLNVRTEAISFRDSDEIDVDKPLSAQFTPADKVTLWKSLGNQGSGNGDIAALTQIHEQIKAEVAEAEQQGKKDNRLRIVIACSDGYPDDEKMVHQLAADLGKLNAVVVGVGLTETAAKVPIIFDTPYSRGDIARDINDLPAIVAKHVIMEAIRLFPEKKKHLVEKFISATLSKLTAI